MYNFLKKLLYFSFQAKHHLSIITEEKVDIDEELDCYQLELENSINEAKIKRKKGRALIEMKQISNVSIKLQNIPQQQEIILEEEEEDAEVTDSQVIRVDETFVVKSNSIITTTITQESNTETHAKETEGSSSTNDVKFIENNDVQYEEIDENDENNDNDELEFKNPAPFTRAFRRRSLKLPKETRSSENIKDNSDTEKNTNHHSIKNLVRRSIRKLIYPNQKIDENLKKTESNDENTHTGLISSIRQSFRRKPKLEKPEKEISDGVSSHEISILDLDDCRQVFREPSLPQQSDQNNFDGHGKTNLGFSAIRSSFRKSTKEAKRQVMKPFIKNEKFAFE